MKSRNLYYLCKLTKQNYEPIYSFSKKVQAGFLRNTHRPGQYSADPEEFDFEGAACSCIPLLRTARSRKDDHSAYIREDDKLLQPFCGNGALRNM